MIKFKEFLEDDKGRLSSTRAANVFVTVFICAIMLLLVCTIPFFINTNPDKDFIATANTASLTQILFTIVQLGFVAAGLAGASYATNKLSDSSVVKAAMNPEQVIVPVPQQQGQTVNVNTAAPGAQVKITPQGE
jgi:hypothetical protein